MDANDGPKESAKAYQAFLEYCALGSMRSLSILAKSNQKYTKSIPLFKRWSTQHNWQERVKQYDAEQLAEKVAAKQKRREEMEERHSREAREEQELARKHIKASIKKDDKGKDVYGRISLPAVQLLKNSREDERKALGIEDADGLAVEVNTSEDNVQVIVYYPQSKDKEA